MTELELSQQKEIARLREENRLLRQKLDLVIRQLFGKKSERLDPAQLELLLSDQALTGAALTKDLLLNDGFEAKVEIKLNGTTYQASARAALAQASSWLNGPIASEWLLRVPF